MDDNAKQILVTKPGNDRASLPLVAKSALVQIFLVDR
jgi:hypothetical protein